jgi:hypothetical protein
MEMQEFRDYDDKLLSDFVRRRIAPWQGIALRPTLQAAGGVDAACVPFHYLGDNRIRTDRWIGTFSLCGQRYQIHPRVGQKRFWGMLMEAEGLPAAGSIEADGGISTGELHNKHILALLWTSALEHGRRLHGISKGYVFREEPDATTLRGRLDLYRQLTVNEFGRQHRIACVYDDLTCNNPVNRAIIFTIKKLQKEGIFPFQDGIGNNPRRERLIDWQERLTSLGVEADDKIMPSSRVRWTRTNDGFRRCYELAERLVHHRGAETATHGLDEAVLFDTAEVWEVFLWERLQRVVGCMDGLRICSPRLQNRFFEYLMKYEGIIRGGLLPDFTLVRKTSGNGKWEAVAILDAKCRALEPINGRWLPHNEEVLQMALYSCNTGQEHKPVPCVLLYPRVESTFGVSGINRKVGDNFGNVGESHLNVPEHPGISWWVIDLPDPSHDREWINEVDQQLKKIIEEVLESTVTDKN